MFGVKTKVLVDDTFTLARPVISTAVTSEPNPEYIAEEK